MKSNWEEGVGTKEKVTSELRPAHEKPPAMQSPFPEERSTGHDEKGRWSPESTREGPAWGAGRSGEPRRLRDGQVVFVVGE